MNGELVRKRIYIYSEANINLQSVTDVSGPADAWNILKEKLHSRFREYHRACNRNRNWAIVDLDSGDYEVFGSRGFASSIRHSFAKGGWRNQLVGATAGSPDIRVEELMPKEMTARRYIFDLGSPVAWNGGKIERLLCLHLLDSRNSIPAWTVIYCQAVMRDGRVVKVSLPFKEIPKGDDPLSVIQAHARKDQVDLEKIEFFKSIDNPNTLSEITKGQKVFA